MLNEFPTRLAPSMRKTWAFRVVGALMIGMLCFVAFQTVRGFRKFMMLNQTHNDLKWIGMALHSYHDKYNYFPPLVTHSEDGKAMHSWRSLLHSRLYRVAQTDDQFDLYDMDQAWDSPANRDVSRHHRFGSHPYQFLAVVGPHAAWAKNRSRSRNEFKDGTWNTMLAIAVRDTGIGWHEPCDAEVRNGELTVRGATVDTSRDVFILLADGSVHYFENGIPPEQLAAMLTVDGGEKITEW